MKLKPYQMVGLSWLNLMHIYGLNGILGDEMVGGGSFRLGTQHLLFLEDLHSTVLGLFCCCRLDFRDWEKRFRRLLSLLICSLAETKVLMSLSFPRPLLVCRMFRKHGPRRQMHVSLEICMVYLGAV